MSQGRAQEWDTGGGGGLQNGTLQVMIAVGMQVFFNWHQIVTFSAQEFKNVHVVICKVKIFEIS